MLAGSDRQVAVYLMPLAADPVTAAWYNDRLAALEPAGPELRFFRLAVFHLGQSGDPDLLLDPLELNVIAAGVERGARPLLTEATAPRVRASVLPHRALDGYRGSRLTPGDSFVAITAFEKVLTLEDVEAGTLVAGGLEIVLRPGQLESDRLAGLLAFPGREDVLLSLAAVEGE